MVSPSQLDIPCPVPIPLLFLHDPRTYVRSREYAFTSDDQYRLGIVSLEMTMAAIFGHLGDEARTRVESLIAQRLPELLAMNPAERMATIVSHGIATYSNIASYSAQFFSGIRQHFFLSRPIVADLLNTSVERVLPTDVPWPFAAFYLHLPVDQVPDGHGGHLATIGVYFSLTNEGPQLLLKGMIKGGGEDGADYHACVNGVMTMATNINTPLLSVDAAKVSADMDMADTMRRIIVGACVYMNRPGTEEYREAVTRETKPHSKDKEQRWGLRLVGERYVSATIPGHGSHASPHTHIRRGHIRRLPGRTIWIRPCWVNAPEALGEKDAAK